jgi:hypothetical protein
MSLESKLALKGRGLTVVGAPKGFSLGPAPGDAGDGALLVFVTTAAHLDEHVDRIVASATADRVTWVAYPKGGQLGTDLNRDSLAGILTKRGIQPVTQIAIDATWSALRFRPGK